MHFLIFILILTAICGGGWQTFCRLVRFFIFAPLVIFAVFICGLGILAVIGAIVGALSAPHASAPSAVYVQATPAPTATPDEPEVRRAVRVERGLDGRIMPIPPTNLNSGMESPEFTPSATPAPAATPEVTFQQIYASLSEQDKALYASGKNKVEMFNEQPTAQEQAVVDRVDGKFLPLPPTNLNSGM
jgi:hypothetical protein